jgi:hypothetical protein
VVGQNAPPHWVGTLLPCSAAAAIVLSTVPAAPVCCGVIGIIGLRDRQEGIGADAIQFVANATSSLLVSNSLVADNGNHGITVYAKGSGTVSAVFNHVQANNNGAVGIFVWGGDNTGTVPVKVTVYNSHASANGDSGFFASTRSGYAATTLMLFHSVAANNWRGLVANGGATLRVGQSTVTGNQIGWSALSGGSVLSYGNNYIDGNASNEGPPPSVDLSVMRSMERPRLHATRPAPPSASTIRTV